MNSFEKQKKFVRDLFGDGKKCRPFFSFKYDGRNITSETLPPPAVGVTVKHDYEQINAIFQLDPSGVRFRCDFRVYEKFPVVEYIPWFENTGCQNSSIISDVRIFDYSTELPPQHRTFGFPDGTQVSVRRNLGSCSDRNDFIGIGEKLWSRPGSDRVVIDNAEGRCSAMFLPFFGVDLDDENGWNFGIGWSGAWKAEVSLQTYHGPYWHAESIRIAWGMRETNFLLLPQEKLRQPGALIQFRGGESIRDGQNIFRHFMLEHHSPHDSSGTLLVPPVSLVTWGGLPTSDMQDRIKFIARENLPYEVYWADAGWSGFPGPCPHFLDDPASDWPRRVGNWSINTCPHPDGLKPVSDCAHDAGMKFLLWFEPERIHAKSQSSVFDEHPEWLNHLPESDHYLYDLGNIEAREYLFDKLISLIDSQGVDIYREDFNIDPAPIWKKMDTPQRIGVSEMKHVAGHYELWEKLRKKYPDMPIDNCASGGRRLDYLSLSCSFPLCQSDYGCFHDYDRDMMQVENFYLDDWIPLHAGFCWMPHNDWYDFLSCLGTGVSSKIWSYAKLKPPPHDNFDCTGYRQMLETALYMRDILISGFIYPLTINPENPENWCARQIHCRAGGAGAVIAFRREKSSQKTQVFQLAGLEAQCSYVLTDLEGKQWIDSGADLMKNGLELTLEKRRSVQLIRYEKNNIDQEISAQTNGGESGEYS